MKSHIAASLLACTAAHVQAFSDSSPFILFSTAKLPPPPSIAQLQTSSQVLSAAKSLLASCPTRRYILVSQPNMHAADIRDDGDTGCQMANLCRAVQGAEVQENSWAVAEVIGQVSAQPLAEYITQACKERRVEGVRVERVELKHLPPVASGTKHEEERRDILGDNDHELGKLLDTLGSDYTVMLLSDPNEFKAYQPDFAEAVHVDMKRWTEEPRVASRTKDNSTSNLPLFEKYQFFTPGIFMSFIVLAIILSILGVGLKALASLEVSYGAFDKEMGPAAQKKQM
ncbi:BIG/ATPase V1 complex, subunit S1 [Achaetomium macrosporum]|uniref:Protein BIG1 n=1 Tax=Achaetomium macrosporum TaxID=79813 RepID=A0AAN7CCQ4_9PEZI|nr:BIG/ATPase V1 complex, subunit S1 [Achaetomium macrosporum]